MICHQIATAHTHAMKMLERSMSDRLPAVEQCRYTNAAARLMDVSQGGALVFQRIHKGATQTVVVQYVHRYVQVGEGGQAVVAGTMKPAKRARRSTRT
jgi:hypothetical protein